jgi:hypothetical protein
MSRNTINSGGTGSSAQHAAQARREEAAQLLEDQAVAQAEALAAAQQAEEIVNNDIAAANAANANADNANADELPVDPAARRLSLLARINIQNITSERKNKIEQGLKILQAKSLPFTVEDILLQPDMINLSLTEDETTDMLEEFLANPSSKDSAEKSLKFVGEIFRMSPPIDEDKAKELQSWSDKFPEETTPISKLLDKDAKSLLNVLIDAKKETLGLTDYEAANWYTTWTHPQLANVVTRLYMKNIDKFKTLDLALDAYKLNIDKLNLLDTAAEEGKIIEIHTLVSMFPLSVTSNKVVQQRMFNKLHKDKIHKDNIFKREMDIAFTENKEQYPSVCIDDWIRCFVYVRNLARETHANGKRWGILTDTIPEKINKRDPNEANPNNKWSNDKKKPTSNSTSKAQRAYERKREMFDRNKNCNRCGSWTHPTKDCQNKNPDCNEDGGDFHTSNKSKQWWQDRKLGPFVHQSLDLKGRTYNQGEPDRSQYQQQNKYGPAGGRGGGGKKEKAAKSHRREQGWKNNKPRR